jgi:hypothetical protein
MTFVFDWLPSAAARRDSIFEFKCASGYKVEREGRDAERSITPKWTRRDGITLSENMGMFEVDGMGKGFGDALPNRSLMA